MKKSYLKYISGFWLLLVIFLLGSCLNDPSDENLLPSKRVTFDPLSNQPLVEYILNSKNEESENFNIQVRKTLDYAKIPYGVVNLKSFNKKKKIASSTRVLAIFDISLLNNSAYQKVLNFVANGGTLFLPSYTDGEQFGFLANLKTDAFYSVNTESTGFNFNINLLPSVKGQKFHNKKLHFGLKKENFKEGTEIWASAANDSDYPTIIHNTVGNGQVIIFNASQYPEKQDRGLFFAAILKGLPNFPYTIANISSIFLDDFPAPLYDVYAETVKTEMNLSQAQFYKNVWWPDMIKLAKEENIVYSTYPCFDYRNFTEPPFLFKEWETPSTTLKTHIEDAPDYLMAEALKEKQEIGLHGYNHVSLIKEDWPSKEFMVLALNSAEKKWISSGYGPLPITYVPPSNIIDSIGFAALEEAIPSIRYNCSTYDGDFDEGGNREFDLEPFNDHFFNFPRNTSGYELNEDKQFVQHSLYLYTGIWSHFIHPDDVFQVPNEHSTSQGNYKFRNPKRLGWKTSADGTLGFLPRFKNYLQKTKKTYPFIRIETVLDAARLTEKWRKSEVAYSFRKDHIKIKTSLDVPNNYWFIYIPTQDVESIEEYLLQEKIDFAKTSILHGELFNIKTKGKSLKLPFKEKENASITIINNVLEDYKNYSAAIAENEKEDIPATFFIKDLSAELENTGLSEDKWLELYKYLGWENRESEIWNLLENAYLKQPDKKFVLLSLKFIENSDYPNNKTRKRWMRRQIETFPNNKRLLLEYLSIFEDEKLANSITVKDALKLIVEEKNLKKQEEYLLGIIEKMPEMATELLNSLQPCQDEFTISIAESIAWFYADKGQYPKAIRWAKCTNKISLQEVTEWRLLTGEYKFLKEQDFPRYIEYLLNKQPKYALKEVINLTPCQDEGLIAQATNLAYTFADQGSFRKAFAWSSCAEGFSEKDRLQWLYELGDIGKLEREYNRYISLNPNDMEVKAYMVQLYLYSNNFEKAWQLASSLKESPEKDALQLELNREVVNVTEKIQFELLENSRDLFYPEVARKIEKKKRIAQNDFIESNSELVSDRLEATSLTNTIAYGVRDTKENTHTFGLTQYNAYALNVDTTSANKNHYLYGAAYGFKTKEKSNKFNYSGNARLEIDQDQKVFYHLTAGVSKGKDSLYSALGIFRKPAITGPAYSLNIYQTQLNLYEEWKINKRWLGIASFEANHYDDENVIDGMLLANISYALPLTKYSSFNPYSEASGMLGNTDLEDGYPYWSSKQRFYGGLGIAYNLKNILKEVNLSLDASAFLDTFSESFQRYRGSLSIPIVDYFYLKANAEFFTLKNFYSNNFQLGLKYYLNKD